MSAARLGVLALQGGFAAHAEALRALGHEVELVREAAALERVSGLVLPGGESTTQLKLLALGGFDRALDAWVRAGHPVLATCAGLILSARQVTGPEQRSFGWLDVSVARNAWGRQLDSFEAVADDDGAPLSGQSLVFIRAPRLVELGAGVEVLARFRGEPVIVRQGKVIGASCHPELTSDLRLHALLAGAALNPRRPPRTSAPGTSVHRRT